MRRGHKSRHPQEGLNTLTKREVVLMLKEQHQLINDNGAQRQQLRVPRAFHWHRCAPLKDILEQTLEQFNGLRTELTENTPHLHPVIVVGVCPTPGCHQRPMGLLAQAAHLTTTRATTTSTILLPCLT